MPKKLKIANIGDWHHKGGSLYVCGFSQKDMLNLINEAYRKVRGLENRPDVTCFSLGYFRTYGSMDCWGNDMKNVIPERGVWWKKDSVLESPIERLL